MYNRAHHNAIAEVLNALNSELFLETECFFGGGTAIVLLLDEYRESVDIDFLCASQQGYKRLRELTLHGAITNLLSPGSNVEQLREIRADQYGIRTSLQMNGSKIKFEIVREARVPLTGTADPEMPVPVLSRDDMYCEKLLANADRYNDKAVMSRDVIDLSLMMSRWGPIPEAAWNKARDAYGTSVEYAFEKATTGIRDRSWLERCMQEMAMEASLEREILDVLGGAINPE